jgi:hypothetical protein
MEILRHQTEEGKSMVRPIEIKGELDDDAQDASNDYMPSLRPSAYPTAFPTSSPTQSPTALGDGLFKGFHLNGKRTAKIMMMEARMIPQMGEIKRDWTKAKK